MIEFSPESPKSDNLSTFQQRTTPIHRHRRSAAVSGDFDAPLNPWGSGVWASSPTKSQKSSLHCSSKSFGGLGDFMSLQLSDSYQFNNHSDFVKPPETFSFPYTVLYDSCTTPPESPRVALCTALSHSSLSHASPSVFRQSPQKRIIFTSRLDSPICLGNSNSCSLPNTRFFTSEETVFTTRSIPEPIIDFDKALDLVHLRLESPRAPRHLHEHSSVSPTPSISHDAFFDTAAIEEEKDSDVLLDVQGSLWPRDDPAFINQAQISQYMAPDTHILTNSSSDSLLVCMRHPGDGDMVLFVQMDRFSSNVSNSSDSEQQSHSLLISPPLPQSKRSGAKANRYMLFYVQTNRVSNALRESSLECVNIVQSNLGAGAAVKSTEHKLDHSLSLPTLRNPTKRCTQLGMRPTKPSRLVKSFDYDPVDYTRKDSVFNPNVEEDNILSGIKSESLEHIASCAGPNTIPLIRISACTRPSSHFLNPIPPCTISSITNSHATSPISIHSDTISSTGSIHSTDRLSVASNGDVSFTKPPKGMTVALNHRKARQSPPSLVLNNPSSQLGYIELDAKSRQELHSIDSSCASEASTEAAGPTSCLLVIGSSQENTQAEQLFDSLYQPANRVRRSLILLVFKRESRLSLDSARESVSEAQSVRSAVPEGKVRRKTYPIFRRIFRGF